MIRQLESETANEIEETADVHVCAQCTGPIKRVGEDLLNYCESCESLEQPTKWITQSEYEAAQ